MYQISCPFFIACVVPKYQSRSENLCEHFETKYIFTRRSCYHLAQTPSWRTTPCRLSATASSIYSKLLSVLETVPPSVASGRAMPWWQGPTYHGGYSYVINFIITTSNPNITTFTAHLICTLFLPLHSLSIHLLLILRPRIVPAKLSAPSVRKCRGISAIAQQSKLIDIHSFIYFCLPSNLHRYRTCQYTNSCIAFVQ